MSGMGGMNTGMPQNMMMSNQAMYNTNMYSQGQQMGQVCQIQCPESIFILGKLLHE